MSSNKKSEDMSITSKQRRKDLFGDCALVEIIHLHDCLRGALNALEKDVTELSHIIFKGGDYNRERNQQLNELERRVASRFKVIWSVFKAHSSAEDEFIWPTLQSKTTYRLAAEDTTSSSSSSPSSQRGAAATQHHNNNTNSTNLQQQSQGQQQRLQQQQPQIVEQEEYEEDHADEERMFSMMDDLLTKLRNGLLRQRLVLSAAFEQQQQNSASLVDDDDSSERVDTIMKEIDELTKKLSQHLMAHLEKEEKQCMPLVVKHLSKTEIHDLVGKIMGRRSADMIAQIMTMAVQNLDVADREEMVTYMKQAMAGTFFDRWLSMSGWMDDGNNSNSNNEKRKTGGVGLKKRQAPIEAKLSTSSNNDTSNDDGHNKRSKMNDRNNNSSSTTTAVTTTETIFNVAANAVPSNGTATASNSMALLPQVMNSAAGVTSQTELEKLIRVIATNPNLSPQQKNTTIQGLRDSVWKSNQRLKCKSEVSSSSDLAIAQHNNVTLPVTSTRAFAPR